jgi:hypothetical protein
MHHRLHAGSDRLETGQPQQVHCCGAQRGHRAGAIAPVAVGVLMELGVPDPVPALNAPTVAYQSPAYLIVAMQAQAATSRQSLVGTPKCEHQVALIACMPLLASGGAA